MSKYNKFIVALAAPLGVLLFALAPTSTETAFHVSAIEWYQVLVSLAAAFGVRQVTNK